MFFLSKPKPKTHKHVWCKQFDSYGAAARCLVSLQVIPELAGLEELIERVDVCPQTALAKELAINVADTDSDLRDSSLYLTPSTLRHTVDGLSVLVYVVSDDNVALHVEYDNETKFGRRRVERTLVTKLSNEGFKKLTV